MASGTCAEALVQLIVFGALSILTDIMLFILPIPILSQIRRSPTEYVHPPSLHDRHQTKSSLVISPNIQID
jgi:hypothetical protein